MRNYVAKHDFNRASTHKSLKDYRRVSKQEVMEENWDVNEFGQDPYPIKAEEDWVLDIDEDEALDEMIFTDPKQWESINGNSHQ